MRRLPIAVLLTAWLCTAGSALVATQAANVYRPKLAVPESLAPFLEDLDPGHDGFPLESVARALDARLRELSDAFRAGRAAAVTTTLLDPAFRGARLLPAETIAGQGPLAVSRAKDLPRDLTLEGRAFGAELQRLTADLRDVGVAEFLVTAIEADGPTDPPSAVRTTVRYDIVGAGSKA